jgi:hypothetical protein
MQPGLHYGVSEAAYHADPAPEPSLSASIAGLLIKRSPRHAFQAHPRLNPKWRAKDTSQEMDDGRVLHAMLLRSDSPVVEVHEDDWRTNRAKDAKAEARAAGKVAVLSRRLPGLATIAEAARKELEQHHDCQDMFQDADAEVVGIWQEDDGSYCRLRIDWLAKDPRQPAYDFKFTTTSAAPDAYERTIWNEHALRTAFYRRGLEQLRGWAPAYRFVVIETAPPYGVSVFECARDVQAFGEDQLENRCICGRAAASPNAGRVMCDASPLSSCPDGCWRSGKTRGCCSRICVPQRPRSSACRTSRGGSMARSGDMPVVFRPAACEGFGLFIALAGSSRSGKTYTALRMATGIVHAAAGTNGRIAAIDTENKRMSHYSKTFRFDVWNMGPPFRPGRFAEAAQRAEEGGYHCLVIDSFSLEWMGEGGVLDMHEAYLKRKCGDDEAKRLRNNQAAWAYAKPPHKKMMASFIQRTIPIIFCLRAEKKTKPDKEGKPIDIGWQPLQDRASSTSGM